MMYIMTFYVSAQVFMKKIFFIWHVQKTQKNVMYVVVL
jgi:hypothetical protein